MLQMFQEDNGNWSMSRVLPFIVVVCIMGCYVYVTIREGKMQILDYGSIIAMIGMTANKVAQKLMEKSNANTTP